MQSIQRFVSAAALTFVSASAMASTTVYTDAASFFAQRISTSYTEDFGGATGLPAGAVIFTDGTFSYSASAPSDLFGDFGSLSTSQGEEAITINFTSGNVFALGGNFYTTEGDGSFLGSAVTLLLSDGTSETFTPTSAANSFRGFISDTAITSIVFGAPNGGGLNVPFAVIDNLTVGTIPEPTSLALVALAAAGLAASRKRAA